MKKYALPALIIMLAVITVTAAVQVVRTVGERNAAEKSFDEIRELVNIGETATDVAEEKSGTTAEIPESLRNLHEINSDFIGWIKIENTSIDYPVMQTKEYPEYYLNHDFDKNESRFGVPFLDAGCNLVESDNFIVYGHNMLDGTMFSDLTRFTDPAFCESMPEIVFNTIAGSGRWRAIMVFSIPEEMTTSFPYHKFIDFSSSPDATEDYIARCKNYAVWYDSDATVEANDKLLTLSTCENTQDDARLVIVAKRY